MTVRISRRIFSRMRLHDRVFRRATASAGAIACRTTAAAPFVGEGVPLTTLTFTGRPIAALAAALPPLWFSNSSLGRLTAAVAQCLLSAHFPSA